LIDSGEIPADRLSMDAIRAWIDARPVKGKALIEQNPSYVFFRMLNGEGPLGAEGVALTPGRSLAVDRRFMPLGAPLWLETHDPLDADQPMNRLMVAQDTGGAIRGVVRGDIFFGAGQEATRRAGNMKRPGRYFILLPNAVSPKL
jgi:membrane-bound lytic murein transglycosylase A